MYKYQITTDAHEDLKEIAPYTIIHGVGNKRSYVI
ncbi:MAG: hypothetical protein ACI9FJ_000663 [Alteromonadaceae bacterium]|jgi:hypothetical protein